MFSNPPFTRKDKHGIKYSHLSAINETKKEEQYARTKVTGHCLEGQKASVRTESLTWRLKCKAELTRRVSGAKAFQADLEGGEDTEAWNVRPIKGFLNY